MRTVGGILLWLGAALGVATLGMAWWLGLNGLYGIPDILRWIGLGVVVGSVAFLALGLMLTGPAKGPKEPKGPKAPKAAKPGKGH